MPYGDLAGIQAGCEVVASGRLFDVPVGDALLGRVIDGLGQPTIKMGKGPGAVAVAYAEPLPGQTATGAPGVTVGPDGKTVVTALPKTGGGGASGIWNLEFGIWFAGLGAAITLVLCVVKRRL